MVFTAKLKKLSGKTYLGYAIDLTRRFRNYFSFSKTANLNQIEQKKMLTLWFSSSFNQTGTIISKLVLRIAVFLL